MCLVSTTAGEKVKMEVDRTESEEVNKKSLPFFFFYSREFCSVLTLEGNESASQETADEK